jgi:hypothetical protein
VSAILKALRKLEEETRQGRSETPPPGPTPEPARRRSPLPTIALSLIAALAAGAAGWALWLRPPAPGEKTVLAARETAAPRDTAPGRSTPTIPTEPPSPAPVPETSPSPIPISASDLRPEPEPIRPPSPKTSAQAVRRDPPPPVPIRPAAPEGIPTGTASPASTNARIPATGEEETAPRPPVAPRTTTVPPDASTATVSRPASSEPPALSLFRRPTPSETDPPAPSASNRDRGKTDDRMETRGDDRDDESERLPGSDTSGHIAASVRDRIPAAHRNLPVERAQALGLEIQALVWSPDPDFRMAVINGTILKHGATVGDATLTHIGEDYIVIRRDGALARVDFTVR